MKRGKYLVTSALASAIMLSAASAIADYSTIAVDGTGINAANYGSSLALQTANPGFGGELLMGELFVANDDTNLYIGITGNNENGGSGYYIFIDVEGLGGLTNVAGGPSGGYGEFDALAAPGGGDMPPGFEAAMIINLKGTPGNGDLGVWDGVANTAGYQGNLGNYSNGFNAAINNSNDQGTPWAAGTVDTGVEIQIPLSALGNPGPDDEIRIFAVAGNYFGGGPDSTVYLSNQLLPNSGTPGNFGRDGSGGDGPGLNYTGTGGPAVTPAVYTIAAASASLGTHTWTGATDNDWATATNWDPQRDTPAATDILVFDTSATVTGVPTQTLAGLIVANNAEVSLTAPAAATLTISGDPEAFHIHSGSELRLTGTNGITIGLGYAGAGLVEGDLVFNATAASVVHRVLASVAGALVVADGGSTAMAPVSTGAAGGFGSSATGGVVYQSGAIHYQGGEKDGTRNGGTGTHPFPGTEFQAGSEYVLQIGLVNFVARTFANLTVNDSSGTLGTVTAPNVINGNLVLTESASTNNFGTSSATTGNILTVEGDLRIEGQSGVVLAMLGTPASAQNLVVRGDVTIDNPSRFNADGSTQRFLVLDGVSQTVDANAASVRGLVIDSDVTLVSPISVLNSVDIQGGSLTASGEGRLLLGAAAEPAPGSYTGPLGSAERLNVEGTNSATLGIPDAPVTFTVTAAGTGTTGVLFGWSDAVAPSSSPANYTAIDRTWNLGIVKGSGFTGTLVFTYDTNDIPGGVNEADLVAARWNGSEWVVLAADSSADPGSNTVTVTGVTEFSEWTLVAEDTATNVNDWMILNLD